LALLQTLTLNDSLSHSLTRTLPLDPCLHQKALHGSLVAVTTRQANFPAGKHYRRLITWRASSTAQEPR
jgi:hypothetical protein